MVLAVISAILIYLLRGKIGLLFGSSAEVNAGVIKVMPIFLVSVPFDAITRVSTAAFYANRKKNVLSYVLTFIEPIIMLVLILMLPPVFGGQIMIWWSAVFAKVITASVSIVLSVRYSTQKKSITSSLPNPQRKSCAAIIKRISVSTKLKQFT